MERQVFDLHSSQVRAVKFVKRETLLPESKDLEKTRDVSSAVSMNLLYTKEHSSEGELRSVNVHCHWQVSLAVTLTHKELLWNPLYRRTNKVLFIKRADWHAARQRTVFYIRMLVLWV